MPEDIKLSQIGYSQLPPPFRGLHSPGVRKHCQVIFACYFRKSSIVCQVLEAAHDETRSKSNKHEAELCVRLCRYLLQQGYPPDSVTVLTAYMGQVLVVKDIMSRNKDFYAGTVVILKKNCV